MKNGFKGFGKVFRFTLAQHLKNHGYRNTTIVFGLILFLAPLLIMVAVNAYDKDAAPYVSDAVKNIYVVEAQDAETMDFSVLNQMGDVNFSNLNYEMFSDVETAQSAAEGSADTLILSEEIIRGSYQLHIIRPNESGLKSEDANAFEDFLNQYYQVILIQRAGLSMEQVQELVVPVSGQLYSAADGGAEDPLEMIREILVVFLPYCTMLLLYFMVLFYGQGVASSAIMEKTSKLLDTFLVSVKPAALMLGKMLAISLSGIIQLSVWIVCLVLGFGGGTMIVKSLNPDTDMILIRLFDSFGMASGLFTPAGIVLAILVMLAGLLMYCALAAIGGALAGKTEDLSTTNMLFTMILIVSFFCTMFGGMLEGAVSGSNWQLYVPFTGMLLSPSMILVGKMSIVQALICLGLILLTTLVLTWIAGKIYKAMVLYKGNPPTPKNIIKILKSGQMGEQNS